MSDQLAKARALLNPSKRKVRSLLRDKCVQMLDDPSLKAQQRIQIMNILLELSEIKAKAVRDKRIKSLDRASRLAEVLTEANAA